MTEMSEPEGYGLIMPFVVCKSQGGIYDDQSFVAGYSAAIIDCLLDEGADDIQKYVPPELVPQIDLIAMRHNAVMMAEPYDDNWTCVSIKRS